MIQMTRSFSFIFLAFLLFLSIVISSDLDLKLEKVAFWSADSKLQLQEVCQFEHINVLILDVLRVLPAESESSNVLKMVPMSENQSEFLPFPHVHRFMKEKEKGAVYADFLDVSGLGLQLAQCQKRNVRILIQVKIEKDLKMSRRKLILLSSLLCNSFILVDGDFYDRPFGKEVRFDGFHFVYDKSTERQVSSVMRNLKERAKIGATTDMILGSSSSDYKYNGEEVVNESNFIVTSVVPKTTKIAFVLVAPGSKLLKSAKLNNFFKGKLQFLDKKGRLNDLKKLISRNPIASEPDFNVFIIAGVLGGSLAFSAITFILSIFFRKRLAKDPIKPLE